MRRWDVLIVGLIVAALIPGVWHLLRVLPFAIMSAIWGYRLTLIVCAVGASAIYVVGSALRH